MFAISLALVPVASNSTMKDGGKPVVAKPVAIPAQPVAGRPFAVSFKVTRSDTGTPFLRGRMTGNPSIAGRAFSTRSRSRVERRESHSSSLRTPQARR